MDFIWSFGFQEVTGLWGVGEGVIAKNICKSCLYLYMSWVWKKNRERIGRSSLSTKNKLSVERQFLKKERIMEYLKRVSK